LTFREIDDASKMTRRCGSEDEHQTINNEGQQMNESQLKAL
jgi:hypothetical protein